MTLRASPYLDVVEGMWIDTESQVSEFAPKVESWIDFLDGLATSFDYVPPGFMEKGTAETGETQTEEDEQQVAGHVGDPANTDSTRAGRAHAPVTSIGELEETLSDLLAIQYNLADKFVRIKSNPPKITADTLTHTAASLSLGSQILAEYWRDKEGASSTTSKLNRSKLHDYQTAFIISSGKKVHLVSALRERYHDMGYAAAVRDAERVWGM